MRIGAIKFALSLTAMLMAYPCARADRAPNYVVPGRPRRPRHH